MTAGKRIQVELPVTDRSGHTSAPISQPGASTDVESSDYGFTDRINSIRDSP